jgi:hypothetical protein
LQLELFEERVAFELPRYSPHLQVRFVSHPGDAHANKASDAFGVLDAPFRVHHLTQNSANVTHAANDALS